MFVWLILEPRIREVHAKVTQRRTLEKIEVETIKLLKNEEVGHNKCNILR